MADKTAQANCPKCGALCDWQAVPNVLPGGRSWFSFFCAACKLMWRVPTRTRP